MSLPWTLGQASTYQTLEFFSPVFLYCISNGCKGIACTTHHRKPAPHALVSNGWQRKQRAHAPLIRRKQLGDLLSQHMHHTS